MLTQRVRRAQRNQNCVYYCSVVRNWIGIASSQPADILGEVKTVMFQAVILGQVQNVGMIAMIVPILVLLKAQHICVGKHRSAKLPLARPQRLTGITSRIT